MAVLIISLLAAATVHYLYGGIRLQTPGDRLTGAAQVQFSVLLGLFVLVKAADYWLDRYDLVSASGNLIDGITYTDDHAVLPAKNILLGISVICAVLFFLNIWRRTWTLPSVGLALLVLSAVLLGMIWPGIVQAFQVRPTEPDKEAPYIANNIASTREAYDLQDVDVEEYTAAPARAPTTRRPCSPTPRRCRWSTRSWCTRRSSRSSRSAPTTRSPTCSTSTATTSTAPTARWCSACASSTSAACPTTRATGPTCTPSTPTATASSRRSPTSGRPTTAAEGTEIQWAEGQQENQNALSEATGGYESRVYYGEQSPDYSIVGKVEGAADVELNLGGESDSSESTTYDGERRRRGRQHCSASCCTP